MTSIFIIFQKPAFHPEILPLDLNELDDIPDFVEKAMALHGHIDVVINNAGISYRGLINDTSISVDNNLMTVNYFGAVAITKGNYVIVIIIYY